MRPASRWLAPLLTALLLLAPASALACSCTNNLTLEQEFGYAAGVFSGRVIAINPVPDDPNTVLVTLDPITRWKGPLEGPQVVATPANEAICGFPFLVGEEYLVFWTSYQHVPYTHLCSRTSLLANNSDVPQLPTPQLPVPAAARSWGALKTIYR
jgi:hypothetical protein